MYIPMLHDGQPTRLSASSNRTSKSVQNDAKVNSASPVPSERQTSRYIEPAEPISRIFPEQSGALMSQIRSVRQTPSTVVTEQFLQARAGSSPLYMQNMASVRAERISNLYADAPRFRNQVDLLA